MATAHAMDRSATDRDTWPPPYEPTLLPVVSRALRTSLHVIVGFAELLHDPDLDAKEREKFASRISAEAETLLRRVESSLLVRATREDAVFARRRSIGGRPRLPRWLMRLT